jgi:hypothetical protein
VNVCSSTEFITSPSGLIESNSYPVVVADSACEKVITVPKGKSINIWFLDFKLGTRDASGKCQNGYVKVTDSTGEYILCGSKKEYFHNTFCSSTVYINYKTVGQASSSDRGFKLYYETFDSSSDCPTDAATTLSPGITTLPPTTQPLPPLTNLQASEVKSFQVRCIFVWF